MINKDKFYEILATGREDDKWDFKENLSIDNKQKFYNVLKDMLAFANSDGGYLVLGVKDKTHELVGVENEIDEAELSQKIESSLNTIIDFKLLYFEDNLNEEIKKFGLLEVKSASRLFYSPKTYSSEKGVIIESEAVYVRRGTRSIKATIEQLNQIITRVHKISSYNFTPKEQEIIKANKESAYTEYKVFHNYLNGNFEFTAMNFGDKIKELCFYQSKLNKLEVAKWLGFEEDKINDYFDGLAFPTLEHILRASKYFDVPLAFFFKASYMGRGPIWDEALVNFSIIQHVVQKNELFTMDLGPFFSNVLWDMAKNICLFVEWMGTDYNDYLKARESTDIFTIKPKAFELYDYLSDMSREEVIDFKDSLSVQHYKIIEKVYQKEDRTWLPEEHFLFSLVGFGKELVCRLINESIKSIEITDGSIEVKYHFIEEIKAKKINGREYKEKDLKLVIHEERV
ncbi:ATP-binding protein [Paenibacillus pabuli]|uniref:ATP-binding protein n=1 Tax=Paenibacillus pabuli TaxID=1472 RepID=UPI000780FD14|nr:ATP-binding protein [Paenibacillus pabuli]MEC0125370.1 ATP-binding protein [Paenibacillus pabuli]